jgi:hypothetical protein
MWRQHGVGANVPASSGAPGISDETSLHIQPMMHTVLDRHHPRATCWPANFGRRVTRNSRLARHIESPARQPRQRQRPARQRTISVQATTRTVRKSRARCCPTRPRPCPGLPPPGLVVLRVNPCPACACFHASRSRWHWCRGSPEKPETDHQLRGHQPSRSPRRALSRGAKPKAQCMLVPFALVESRGFEADDHGSPNHAAFSSSATAATAVEVRAGHRNRTSYS